jgi:nitroreductase
MTDFEPTITPPSSMTAMEIMYHRRSVRDYTKQKLDEIVIHKLLDAAVVAPTAMHQEPWSFIVIQDQALLNRLSDFTKESVRKEALSSEIETSKRLLHVTDNPEFHVFHNAGTLIVICGPAQGSFVEADCWLAAENLMLAACANGLGTCVIGFAVEAMNTPEWRKELSIPEGLMVIAPLIIGVPAGATAPTTRKPPVILLWK